MTEILMATCRAGLKILLWKRDLLIVNGGMRNNLKLTAGYGMKNRKSLVTDITRRNTNLTRRDQDKHSELGGMAGLSQK